MPLNTLDYRNAPSGNGPLANEWENKPYRLIYDLCAEIERLKWYDLQTNTLQDTRKLESYKRTKFTLYWLDKPSFIVWGRNIQEAFRLGGFGAESLESLDYYTEE